jgi:hypothetical protein
MIYKQFISNANRRKVRKELLYQVLIEDICDVFGAEEEAREKFRLLIEGKELVKAEGVQA